MEVVMPVRSSTKVAAVLLGFATFDRAAATEPISIVALGASDIHGKGVALSEAFPAQLENMLRADGFNVQVINAGVDGDTTTGMLFRMDSGAASVFEARSQGDKETKPTPNLGVGHW